MVRMLQALYAVLVRKVQLVRLVTEMLLVVMFISPLAKAGWFLAI